MHMLDQTGRALDDSIKTDVVNVRDSALAHQTRSSPANLVLWTVQKASCGLIQTPQTPDEEGHKQH